MMKLKICGMNKNTTEVSKLEPHYLGFIFWKSSKRCFEGIMPKLPKHIKKVGVFVNETIAETTNKINSHQLNLVQLHGNETPEYCTKLKQLNPDIKIIKVFSIKNDFNFKNVTPFETVCDFYLFDTKGKLPGGNGYSFDWSVLNDYPSTKPYFLSGGIGLNDTAKINEFKNTKAANFCYALDINSKFEIEPGLKHIDALQEFKTQNFKTDDIKNHLNK